jgi:hypothetical protein
VIEVLRKFRVINGPVREQFYTRAGPPRQQDEKCQRGLALRRAIGIHEALVVALALVTLTIQMALPRLT